MADRRGFSPSAGEPQAGVPRWTSGRECWVFRAETPGELCGYHPRLIASALRAGERLQYLLYSPVFDAKDGPFRVGGAPGSHAVGITARALLVSRDPHTDASDRSVARIALATVSSLDIGCALALGWFVVHYRGPDGPTSCPVLFGSRGIEHFHEIVRAWRRAGQEESVEGVTRLDWPEVLKGVPVYLRAEVQPLIDSGERLHAVLRTPESWTAEKRWWGRRPVCASSPGLLVATSRGLLWATSEPRQKPDGLSFGVNVAIVRPELVRRAAIGGREGMRVLRVQAGDGPSGRELEVPFDDDLAAAENVVRLAMAWRQRA